MDEVEAVARAIADADGSRWDSLQTSPGPGWPRRQMLMRYAEAAIAAMPTTFTGPFVKTSGDDGSMTLTHVGENDHNVSFVISAEDVKRLFGGGK